MEKFKGPKKGSEQPEENPAEQLRKVRELLEAGDAESANKLYAEIFKNMTRRNEELEKLKKEVEIKRAEVEGFNKTKH